jgi:hypothetical protein
MASKVGHSASGTNTLVHKCEVYVVVAGKCLMHEPRPDPTAAADGGAATLAVPTTTGFL